MDCVYNKEDSPLSIDELGSVINHLDTVANLRLVGKSYGKGAIKVEPSGLRNLPINENVAELVGSKYK